jgi:hypothetical protein
MVYGQSITDPCLSWEDSELLLEKAGLRLILASDVIVGWRCAYPPTIPSLSLWGGHQTHLPPNLIPSLFHKNACREFALY